MNGKGDTFRKVDGPKYRQNHDDIFRPKEDDWDKRKINPLVHPCTDCPKDDTCGTPCTALALYDYRSKKSSKS